MPLLLLLLLVFTCRMDGWLEPMFPTLTLADSAALTCMAMATVVLLAWLMARWTRWALLRFPDHREVVLARYGFLRNIHFLVHIVLFGVALYVFGWGWAVGKLCELGESGPVAPGAELVLLAPFLAAMVLSWICFYDAELAVHDTMHSYFAGRPFWSRASYVMFHIRQNLALVIVPILVLVFLQGLSRLYPDMPKHAEFQALSFGLLLAMFLCMPLVLRWVLGLRPLPPGPLRDRLMNAAKRLNFRCRDVLVWNTRQGVANAMVVGLAPWLRYVVLTDRLLVDLTPEEVEAVFGHEIGHVKHHHMAFYFGFLVISLFVLVGIMELAFGTLEGMPLVIGSLAAYIFVVFGFLSRRCERQADIFGCRSVSCNQADCPGHDDDAVGRAQGRGLCATGIRTFVQALEKVAVLNGISRNRPGLLQSWQHSTIARRVEFLQQIQADPSLEPHFQRRVFLVKCGLMLALSLLLGILTWTLAQDEPPSRPDSQARVSGQ